MLHEDRLKLIGVLREFLRAGVTLGFGVLTAEGLVDDQDQALEELVRVGDFFGGRDAQPETEIRVSVGVVELWELARNYAEGPAAGVVEVEL